MARYKWQLNNGSYEVFLEDIDGFTFICDCSNQETAEKVMWYLNNELFSGNDKDAFDAIPDYGELFEIDRFVELCKEGSFIDTDGSGYYAYINKMAQLSAVPSRLIYGEPDRTFTHVVWFNK